MKYVPGFIALVLLTAIPIVIRANPTVYPLGTTIYKPDKCWNGFTILSAEEGRLIDMNGNLVHLWKGKLHHPNKVYPGGYLLASTAAWKYGQQDAIEIQLRNFDDKVLWRFDRWIEGKANEGDGTQWFSRQHHDLQIKGNPVGYYIPDATPPDISKGTILALAHYNVRNDKVNKNVPLVDDVVYEIDMASREIIWKWKASEHLDEMGFDQAALDAMQNYKTKPRTEGGGFDWLHQNCVSYLGPNKWYDQGDLRFHPDNIILDSREAGFLAIVSHESGKIVWRAGPYYRDGEDKKLGWMVGNHHTHMIPKGLPGAGNIMVFDNGGASGYGPPTDFAPNGISVIRRDYSRVVEFNPVTKEIVWEYSPNTSNKPDPVFGHRLYSVNVSSAQRLPNGNTLITEGAKGRIIEVTRDYEIVWEYMNPYLWDSDVPLVRNLVYRAYRVPYDWVPQLPKPKESAVDAGLNYLFTVPAEDGSRPDFGIGKTGIWTQGGSQGREP
jgi:hypothetical protein